MESTSEDKDKRPSNLIYLLAMIAGLGGVLFGYDTGVISGAILFVKKSFSLTTFAVEITVSTVLLGALFGALGSGKVSDHYGRRTALMVASAGFILGTLLSSLAANIFMLIIGRFIIGLAIGVASYTVPLYISEISPKEKRGGLVILNTIAVTGGILIAYIVNYIFAPSGNWRWMFGMGVIPALLMGIGLLFLPRSPRWLMQQNRRDEAVDSLKLVRATDDAHAVQSELNDIEQVSNSEESSWRDLLNPMIRPVLIIGLGLAIIQQVTGINVVLYYAPSIFNAAGFHGTTSQMLATLGMGLTNFLMTIVAVCLVDKVGRRRLLLIGLSGMTFGLVVVALSFYFSNGMIFWKWLTVAGLVLFISMYALSVGCLFWLVISEIYPLNVRGKAMSLAAATNWMANFIVALTFLTLLGAIGPTWTFGLYGIAGILSVAFCYCLVPETKMVSLETIEENLRAGKPSRGIGFPLS